MIIILLRPVNYLANICVVLNGEIFCFGRTTLVSIVFIEITTFSVLLNAEFACTVVAIC